MSIEKDWVTKSGLRAVIVKHDELGHFCGYVGVPKDHPEHGKEYYDVRLMYMAD